MIYSMQFTNYLNESVNVVLGEAEPKHGLLVINVDGLGPVTSEANKIDLATRHGSKVNSVRANDREIVLTLRFTWAKTIEDVRQLTYKYFPLTKMLKMKIKTDNRMLETEGYVTENDPEIWSEAEETQITILCPDPWLYSAEGNQVTDFYGVIPLFEFPFENNSLKQNLIEFGEIAKWEERILDYVGDAEVGFIIRIKILNPVTDITFYKIDTREEMTIYVDKIREITGGELQRSDEIIISTVKGDKYAYIVREGLWWNILNAIDLDSDWFELWKGKNVFMYDTDRYTNLEVTIENKIAYEGI